MRICCYCLLLFCTLFFNCCKRQSVECIQYDSFNQVLPLSSEKVEVPPVLLYPRALYFLDDYLVVLNEKTDTLFQVFKRSNLDYVCQTGIVGDGPEDFHLPHIQPVINNENGVVLCDLSLLKRLEFKKNKIQVQVSQLPQNSSYYNGLVQLADSVYCCRGGFESEYELQYLYPDGSVKEVGRYPEDFSSRFENILQRNEAYIGLPIVHPSGKMLALFYQHLRRWRLYNDEGLLTGDYMLCCKPGDLLPAVEDGDRYIHPVSVYATEKYIYTLNLDMKADEIVNKARNANIQVFDWEGNPVRQFLLDCLISSFVVDEKQNIIYGVFVDDMEHIYKFKF